MSNMVRQLSVHKEHEVLLKLEFAGLNDKLAQVVIESKGNNLAAKIVKLIQAETTTNQISARLIMNRGKVKNYFGVEEAILHFSVKPTREQLLTLEEVPFSEATLEECKNTHILVAVFPLSILNIKGKALNLFHNQDWYNRESFTKDCGEAVWRLVRKTPVPNSTSKTWGEQQALLAKNEEIPKTQVLVYAIIGHYLATGERLFEKVYVRCLNIDLYSDRVDVGVFDSDGLLIRVNRDSIHDDHIGLASARKRE